jgi:hypothetical protein
MVSTIHRPTLYEFQIELVNRKNPQQSLVKEQSSMFEVGESKGYSKFVTVDNLRR